MANYSKQMVDLDGQPIGEFVPSPVEGAAPIRVKITLGRMASNALVQIFNDEPSVSGDEKVKRWQIAMKVRGAKELELPVEDVSTIKKCIAKAYGPMLVGQAFALLDPAGAKKH